jgi:hypothetical protein
MTQELYEKSVDKLLEAYTNDTLIHQECHACAVGNLLDGKTDWAKVFCFNIKLGDQECYLPSEKDWNKLCETKREDGYSWNELAAIEEAFETAFLNYVKEEGIMCSDSGDVLDLDAFDKAKGNKKVMLLGLTAVLDKMASMIEEDVDVEADKKRLEKVYEGFVESGEFTNLVSL